MSDSLEQLSEISKSVDDLVDMNVPYGEKVQNYEKLTEYLNQANMIHSKISKSLGKKYKLSPNKHFLIEIHVCLTILSENKLFKEKL